MKILILALAIMISSCGKPQIDERLDDYVKNFKDDCNRYNINCDSIDDIIISINPQLYVFEHDCNGLNPQYTYVSFKETSFIEWSPEEIKCNVYGFLGLCVLKLQPSLEKNSLMNRYECPLVDKTQEEQQEIIKTFFMEVE